MRAPPSLAVPGKVASCTGSSLCPESPTPLLGTGTRQKERLPWPGLPSRLQCLGSTVPMPEPCRAGIRIVPPSPSSPAPLLAACAGSPGISGAENWSCWKRRAGRAGHTRRAAAAGSPSSATPIALPPEGPGRGQEPCGGTGGSRRVEAAPALPRAVQSPGLSPHLCPSLRPGASISPWHGQGPCFRAVFLPWPVAARSVLIWDTRQSRL